MLTCEAAHSKNKKSSPKQSAAALRKHRAAMLRKYRVVSANPAFRTKIADSLHLYETLKFTKRPASVHPEAIPWLHGTLRRWVIQRTGSVSYVSEATPSLAAICDGTAAAFASESRDIFFCPTGMTSPFSMLATLYHEIGHITLGTWEARPHVACTRGAEPGTIRCDPTIYPNPNDLRNGAFANTVYYYHTLYKMGSGLSAFQRRQAVYNGEYFLNNYVNVVTPNPAYSKQKGAWRFR